MRSLRFIPALALFCVLSLEPATGQMQPSAFHIAILDGEGALNNVKGRLAREPIVQVEDQNHKRVAGAYVTFDTPGSGPSGVFADGSTHLVTTTNAEGRAVAHGLRPNAINGKFDIHVHVTYQGEPVADTTIHQVNVSGPVANLSKNLENGALVASVAAGVLGVVVGSEFQVNGTAIHGNANLANGARLQTLATTVKLYVQDGGEFLIAPRSAVTVAPNLVNLQTGVLRARYFGKTKVIYHTFQVIAGAATADAVVGLSADGLQVASLDGPVQVLAADGSILDTVDTGLVSTFGNVPGAASGASSSSGSGASSGASTAPQIATRKRLPLYYLTLGAALAGLGVAIDTIAAPPPTSP